MTYGGFEFYYTAVGKWILWTQYLINGGLNGIQIRIVDYITFFLLLYVFGEGGKGGREGEGVCR